MLILLTLHIIRQFFRKRNMIIDLKGFLDRLVLGLKYGLPFLLISFNANYEGINSEENLRFDIIKKEKVLGFIDIKKITEDQTTTFKIKSEVNAKVLVNFKASSEETYIYNTDTLVYSAIYRTVNKRVQVDQSIKLNNGKYHLTDKKRTELLDLEAIKCNLVRLFFDEPVNVKSVYCDKLNTYVRIIRMSPDIYKVVFPNKSYNLFYYQDGKCKLIEAVGSFYKVKLIPDYKD